MTQTAHPIADTSIGAYTDEAGGTTTIYTHIDESVADDADYIKSEASPASSPYVCQVTSLEDPVSSSSHVINFRYRKSSSGGQQIDLTVELRQGYVSEASQGTLIATTSVTDISSTWTAGTYTLSGAEADAISDYTDLYLRFVFNAP